MCYLYNRIDRIVAVVVVVVMLVVESGLDRSQDDEPNLVKIGQAGVEFNEI